MAMCLKILLDIDSEWNILTLRSTLIYRNVWSATRYRNIFRCLWHFSTMFLTFFDIVSGIFRHIFFKFLTNSGCRKMSKTVEKCRKMPKTCRKMPNNAEICRKPAERCRKMPKTCRKMPKNAENLPKDAEKCRKMSKNAAVHSGGGPYWRLLHKIPIIESCRMLCEETHKYFLSG